MSRCSAVSTYRAAMVVLCFALLLAVIPALVAQDTPAPRAEIFGGYSWYNAGNQVVGARRLPDFSRGWGFAPTINLSRWVGITGDIGGHYSDFATAHSFMIGPQFKFRSEHVSPFAQALFGFQRMTPIGFNSANKFAIGLGGGIDVDLNRYVALRIFQADYIRNSYIDVPRAPKVWLDGARLQGGLLLKVGTPPAEGPVSATCSAKQSAVMAGEPVTVTITPTGFLPKRTLTYEWTSTGGKVSGNQTSTTVDTNGLAPGNYTVTGKVTDNGKGKHQQTATCNASFTINEPPKHPPTISCTPGATTVRAGDPVTITCQATSPDNRPLTYQWNTSAGRINGNGPTATLDTAGAPAGPINITTTVSDDRNLTATGNSSVNVEVPPPPPTASKINSINFPDTKKPARVDNAAKAVLDDVALRLQREADARAVVVGYGTGTGRNANLGAQRAVNTKAYLTQEKGIDPSRIEVRSGTGDQTAADIWIVPPGANFTEQGTTVVNEQQTKPQAAPARRPARRGAAPAR